MINIARAGVGFILGGSMTTSALAQVVAATDFNDGPQGWTFDIAARWRADGGNSGGCVENFAEDTNGPAWAMASQSFLRNWTGLNNQGVLRFDHRRVSNGGGSVLSLIPIIVEVSGPGGTARWESELLPNPGPWRTFEIPIAMHAWGIQSASEWASILADVTRVRFFLEQVSNTASPEDLNLLDNVALIRICPTDFDGDGFVTGADFDLYVQAFESGDASADFDGDTFVTGVDFDLFVQAFEAGC